MAASPASSETISSTELADLMLELTDDEEQVVTVLLHLLERTWERRAARARAASAPMPRGA